jgi:hypothetical protein
MARLGNFVPNALITRAVGGVLRPKFEGQKQIESADDMEEN